MDYFSNKRQQRVLFLFPVIITKSPCYSELQCGNNYHESGFVVLTSSDSALIFLSPTFYSVVFFTIFYSVVLPQNMLILPLSMDIDYLHSGVTDLVVLNSSVFQVLLSPSSRISIIKYLILNQISSQHGLHMLFLPK